MPEDKGWAAFVDLNPLGPYEVAVEGGHLHLSTLALATTGTSGGGVGWTRSDVPIDFSNDFAAEVTVRIASAPDHSANKDTGWPRPGYAFQVMDIHGHAFWIGLGASEVFLSNNLYGLYGSDNTLAVPFNTTDGEHVYTIERAAGGVGASLRIDGVIVLTLPALGPVYSGPLILFGDPTYWANSDSYTSRVRVSPSPAIASVGPRDHEALLWAGPYRNPSNELRVRFRASLGGEMTFEVFDLVGRRVNHASRTVSQGETGEFSVTQALAPGVYGYRVRLESAQRQVVERSGRVVLVH